MPPPDGYADRGAGDAVAPSVDARVSGAPGGSRGFGYQSAGGHALADGAQIGGGTGVTARWAATRFSRPTRANPSGAGQPTKAPPGVCTPWAHRRSFRYQYFGAQSQVDRRFGRQLHLGNHNGWQGHRSRLHQIFERLTLEPAALDADETAFFEEPAYGGRRGQALSPASGAAGSPVLERSRPIHGTTWPELFELESDAPGDEPRSVLFDAAYRARTNRTVEAL